MTTKIQDYFIGLALASLSVIVCVSKMYWGHDWGGDFSGYIAQAISITTHSAQHYIADNTQIISQTDGIYGPYAYPWGFPILLAFMYKLFGFNFYAFKSVGVICFGIFVLLFYVFCRKYIARKYAFCATLLFALNPSLTMSASNSVLSDIPFLCVGFGTLLALGSLFGSHKIGSHTHSKMIQKVTEKANIVGGGAKYNLISHSSDSFSNTSLSFWQNLIFYGAPFAISLLGGILMLLACLIRMNGMVIVLALLCMHSVLMLKCCAPNLCEAIAHKPYLCFLRPIFSIKTPFSLCSAFGFGVHILPYIVFGIGYGFVVSHLSSGGSGHFEIFASMSLKSIVGNLRYYTIDCLYAEFFAIPKKVLNVPIFVLCVPLMWWGLVSVKKFYHAQNPQNPQKAILTYNQSQEVFFGIFILGFLGLLVLWVALQGIRFVYLVLPFMVFWGARGVAIGRVGGINASSKIKTYTRFVCVLLMVIMGYFVINNLVFTASHKAKQLESGGSFNPLALEVYEFIKAKTPQDAKILFIKPRVLYLATHRLSFASSNINRIKEADYVLLCDDMPFSQEGDLRFQEQVKLVFENAKFRLYQVLR